MDDVDRAAQEVERFQQQAVANAKALVKLMPKGTCYWCHEPIELPKLFCNAECADDYHRRQERKV